MACTGRMQISYPGGLPKIKARSHRDRPRIAVLERKTSIGSASKEGILVPVVRARSDVTYPCIDDSKNSLPAHPAAGGRTRKGDLAFIVDEFHS